MYPRPRSTRKTIIVWEKKTSRINTRKSFSFAGFVGGKNERFLPLYVDGGAAVFIRFFAMAQADKIGLRKPWRMAWQGPSSAPGALSPDLE
ncbi:MAG: hypothetical protein A2162_11305 [Deltaproteobacteria bacterium RBG_13_52_11b]|nr:MAG: hypothetical protein A2162_11305 [Deltaproteobacteria bacterium RBG_13_52_11b]